MTSQKDVQQAGVEAVAWRYKHRSDDEWTMWGRLTPPTFDMYPEDWEIEPLYAHPPAAEAAWDETKETEHAYAAWKVFSKPAATPGDAMFFVAGYLAARRPGRG